MIDWRRHFLVMAIERFYVVAWASPVWHFFWELTPNDVAITDAAYWRAVG